MIWQSLQGFVSLLNAGLLLTVLVTPTAWADQVAWPVDTPRQLFDFCVTPELGVIERENILRAAGWVPFEPVLPKDRPARPWDAGKLADLAILGVVVSNPYLGRHHDIEEFRRAFDTFVVQSDRPQNDMFAQDMRKFSRDGALLALGPMRPSNGKENGRWRVECFYVAPAQANSAELRVLPGRLVEYPGTRFLLDMRGAEGFGRTFTGSVIIAKGKTLGRFLDSTLPDIVAFESSRRFEE